MNRTLGKRHLQLARRTLHASTIGVDILEKSIARVWTDSGPSYRSRDSLDFESAVSGDDLARIRVGEYWTTKPIVKPIGEQSGIWSDVRHHAGKWAA